MGNSLYFLRNGIAVEMNEQPYEQEKVLQNLIARNPNILLQSSDPNCKKLFLISQEFLIAEGGESTNSYFLDLLMVDEGGTPVLVEVKRASDTRSRREVVAQMLDYASRVSTWDVKVLKDGFLKNNQDMFETEFSDDTFWEQVENSLKAERIRLVFAADQIPDTLRALIEFLNRNLSDIEVYGVEIQQYQTQDATLLTSNIIGGGSVDRRRASLRSIEWDAAAFSECLLKNKREDALDVPKHLIDFSARSGLSYLPGCGTKFPSFSIRQGQTRIFTASSWFRGSRYICVLEFCIRDLLEKLPSWSEQKLCNTLSSMPGADSARTENNLWKTTHYFYIEMHVLSIPENMSAFEKNITELCSALSQSQNSTSLT